MVRESVYETPEERAAATRVKRLYDEYFHVEYDKHMEATNHYATMKKVIERLGGYFQSPLLDPCCGTGEALLTIRKVSDSGSRTIIANDFSESMLSIARGKVGGDRNTLFTTFDALQLPIADKSVNTVFCSYSFHWFVNRPSAVKEFARVLAPKGTLIAVEEFPLLVTDSEYMPENIKHWITDTVGKTKLKTPKQLAQSLEPQFDLAHTVVEEIDNRHSMYGMVFKSKQ